MESANMNPHLDKLSEMLNLSPYQKNALAEGQGKYDMSRLVKRGALLYAPYDAGGLIGMAADLLRGRRADLIGRNKTLLRNMRGIRFYSAGCRDITRGVYARNTKRRRALKLCMRCDKFAQERRIEILHYFRQGITPRAGR